MATMEINGGVERLCTGDLTVDRRYQRELDPRRVETIATSWDERLEGALVVNRRSTGKMVVVDGQHRLAAARMAGVESLPCIMLSIDVADEPQLFVDLQTKRKMVSPVDRHKALAVAGDIRANDVDRVLGAIGLRIGAPGSGRHVVSCVGAVYKAYDRGGPEHLSDAVWVLRRAWPDRSMHGQLLNGASIILATDFRRQLHKDRLVDCLSSVTPQRILGETKDGVSGNVGLAIARVLLRLYNRGKGGTKLDVAALEAGLQARQAMSRAALKRAKSAA